MAYNDMIIMEFISFHRDKSIITGITGKKIKAF